MNDEDFMSKERQNLEAAIAAGKTTQDVQKENLGKRIRELQGQGLPKELAIIRAQQEWAQLRRIAEKIVSAVRSQIPKVDLSSMVTGMPAGYAGHNKDLGLKEIYNLYEEPSIDENDLLPLIEELTTAGMPYIFQERAADWRKTVTTSVLNGGRFGQDIRNALKVMEVLDGDATVESVVETFNNRQYGEALLHIFRFSKRGPEFFESFMTANEIEIDPKIKKAIDSKKAKNRALAQKELERIHDEKLGKIDKLNDANGKGSGLRGDIAPEEVVK